MLQIKHTKPAVKLQYDKPFSTYSVNRMPFKLGGIFYSTFGNIVTPFFGSNGIKSKSKWSADNVTSALKQLLTKSVSK